MRNDNLPSTINESTLVPKLTFLERAANEIAELNSGAGNPVGADRLRAAFVEHNFQLNDKRTAVPKPQRIDSWLAGEPISASELGYLSFFFQSRYVKKYDNLEPEQKRSSTKCAGFSVSMVKILATQKTKDQLTQRTGRLARVRVRLGS